jgi:hypothetical protein
MYSRLPLTVTDTHFRVSVKMESTVSPASLNFVERVLSRDDETRVSCEARSKDAAPKDHGKAEGTTGTWIMTL